MDVDAGAYADADGATLDANTLKTTKEKAGLSQNDLKIDCQARGAISQHDRLFTGNIKLKNNKII